MLHLPYYQIIKGDNMKKFFVSIVAFLSCFMVSLPSYAHVSSTSGLSFSDDVRKNLIVEAQTRGYGVVEIDGLEKETLEKLREKGATSKEIALELADAFFPEVKDFSTGVGYSTRGTNQYTARVFAGLPMIGACNIYQDLSATVFQHRVRSHKLLGNSYVGGVCLFAWTSNRSWAEQNGKIFNVYMKGTASAIVKGSSITFNPTFKAIFDVRKNSLVQRFQ